MTEFLTIPQMAEQVTEWFSDDTHILGRDETTQSNFCAYRTPTGLKCAVGCLIPDDMYDPRLDGRGPVYQEETEYGLDAIGDTTISDLAQSKEVQNLFSKFGIDLTDADTVAFLSELQTKHDDISRSDLVTDDEARIHFLGSIADIANHYT